MQRKAALVTLRGVDRVPTSSGNHGNLENREKKFHAWKNHGI